MSLRSQDTLHATDMAQTPEIQEFFEKESGYKLLEELINANALGSSRERQKALFDAKVQEGEGLSENGKQLFSLIRQRQTAHNYAKAGAYPQIYKLHFKTECPTDRLYYDNSMDTMHVFILVSHIDLGIKHKDMPRLVEQELKIHCRHEQQNHGHEKLTENECKEEDILEMAVDGLIRNLQFKNGDLTNIDKFKPVFCCGDEQTKKNLYEEYVQLYQGKFKEIWNLHIFPELEKRAKAPLRLIPCECPMMVETEEIRGYLDSLSNKDSKEKLVQELYNIVAEISDIGIPREDRQTKFDNIVKEGKNLSGEGNVLLQLIKGREETHIYAMAAVVWPEIHQMHFKKKIPSDRPWHDHSKDTMFKFILAANYDLKVDHAVLPELVRQELDRHYWWEPHHPEHEKETGRECTDVDILEMATDRLTRNLQFNKGIVDIQKLKRFEPKFPRGNHEEKVKMYWEFVNLYKDKVQEIWQQVYGDQIHGEKRKNDSFPDEIQTKNVRECTDEDGSENETEEEGEEDGNEDGTEGEAWSQWFWRIGKNCNLF